MMMRLDARMRLLIRPVPTRRSTVSVICLAIVFGATIVQSVALGAQQPASTDPYAHYVTPGWCEAAAERMDKLYWRDKRPDTVTFAPLTDSVPAPVKDSARVCAARFAVATTPVRELLPLVQLSLWAGLDTQARAAADRLIAAQATETPTARGWIVRLVAESFLDAKPTRLADGRRYLAQLDSLGAPAGEWRVMAHTHLGELRLSLGDLPGANAEYRAAIVGADQMSKTDRMNNLDRLVDMYSAATEVLGAESGGPAAIQFADSALRTVSSLRPAGSPDAMGLTMQFRQLEGLYQLYGSKAPLLTASRWYTAHGDTVRPWPGVASLIVFGSPNCGGHCYPRYATIRRLEAKYGTALQTTMVTETGGYYHNHLTTTLSAEADSTRHYFMDFLELPTGIAVSDVAFSFGPDGRRVNQAPENIRNYSRGPNAVLVGRDGTIKLAVTLGPEREHLIEDVISAGQK